MNVTVADIGVGNVGSVILSLEDSNIVATASSNPSEWERADLLVLPGVGSFDHYISRAHRTGLASIVQDRHFSGVGYQVGICVGMQALFEGSEEGTNEGFGLFKSHLKRFSTGDFFRVHMGWNKLVNNKGVTRELSLDSQSFYFCHSYFVPESHPRSIAESSNGVRFTAAVASDRTLGLQFHPEKSSMSGRELWGKIINQVEKGRHFDE